MVTVNIDVNKVVHTVECVDFEWAVRTEHCDCSNSIIAIFNMKEDAEDFAKAVQMRWPSTRFTVERLP